MFVAVPAFYFYLGDNNTSRLEDAETGQIEPHLHASNSSNTSAEVKERWNSSPSLRDSYSGLKSSTNYLTSSDTYFVICKIQFAYT